MSDNVAFTVSDKTVLAALPPIAVRKGNINGDKRIDLVDFSIAAYWINRPLSAEFKKIEAERLNNDGKIDLVDLSIMAYYWTG